MDQSSSQTDIKQSESLSDSTTANKKSGWMYAFFAATIILLLGFTLAIYNYKNTNNLKFNSVTQNKSVEVDENPKPTDVEIVQSDIQKNIEELSTTPKLFMGAYTFDYPSKWHIANQWPNNESDPITIFLDPNP